jgi:Ca-activated chloride channel family protein
MKTAPIHSIAIAVLIIFFAGAGYGQDEEKSLSPYFFVKGDPQVDRLPLKDTKVEVSIAGVIADVRVVQTYKNEGKNPINASYVFPASTRAAVYGMRMKIRDEIISAKIKEREQAKQDFEAAKKEGKSASLLEQQRPNVFSMSLANIMPGDDIQVELRYTELIVSTDGTYEFVYPTVVGPRYPSADAAASGGQIAARYLPEEANSTSTLHIDARIAAGLPIRELSCPSHKIAPRWENPTSAGLTLDEANAFQGNRDFVLRYRLTGGQIASGLMLFQGEDKNFFLYMAQPPERVESAALPPREYVFVVDVSGSMDGFPIETSKTLLSDLIGKLKPTDYFNVVLFAGDSTVLSETPLEANPGNIARALDLLSQQRGSGGTELLEALKTATALASAEGVSRSVVLITDGYISGEKGAFDHIRANLGNTNFFAFGIGSSVNRYLIEGVAKAGRGEPFIVLTQEYAPEAAEKFRKYIENPVLTNIKVEAKGFDIYDVEPLNQPDLFASRPVIVFGKWRGSPSGTIELSGTNGDGKYVASLDVSAVQPDERNSALRYLWARSRIAELSDYGSSSLDDKSVREITDLGLKYNLLTAYTSFIAIREKVVNPNGDATNVEQPLPLPVGVSDMAVGSEPELLILIVIAAAFAMVIIVRRRTALIRPLQQ